MRGPPIWLPLMLFCVIVACVEMNLLRVPKIILILFCIIRRFAWDHGRIALIQEEDQGQTETSYGSRQTSEEGCASQEGGINTAKTQGCFSWIRVFMRVTEKQIRLKCGENAFHYIRFQKHILFYSVIIFGLSIGIILQVNNSGTNEPVKDSFGTTTVSNLIANSNIFWCHTVFAILYTVFMVIVLRKFSKKLKFESHNDSKKTSMMTNVPKNVTSELINQHFREIYGESQVLEVQVAFDFVKLKQAKRKVLAAQMGREHCEELLRKTRERPLTTVSTNKLSPCCHCCGSSHVDGIEYFTEEEEKGKVEVDQHRQELKSLGIAFVTFKNAENVERCLGDFNTKSESSVSRRDFLDNAKVSKAPLPGDIIWEHLSVDNKNFCFRAWLINTALFIFVLFFTTPTVALSTLQELKAIIVKSNPKLAVPPNPFFTQFVPTILLWSFAAILPAVVSGSSYCEAHWKRSKLEHSVMIKTYIFLMLMLIILPSLTLTSADALFHLTLGGRLPEFQSRLACVFLPNNGAFFVNYLVTSALIGTALELCRFPELVSYGGSMVLARNEGEKRLVRKEAVRDFAYGRQYAWMLVIFTMMVVYSLTCPLVTPFGLLYLAMKHLVDRYNLYFNYRPAADNHVDNKVHYIAMTFAVFSTFFLFLSLFSYSFIRLGFNDPHTVFTLCITFGTLLLLIARVCFGMFKKCGPQEEEYNLIHSDERHIPEAYLPPALRTTREMKATGSGSDSVSPPRLSKPKTYGTTANDQVTFADEEGR